MAIEVATGSLALGTTTGNKTVSGLSFQPKAVVFLGTRFADPSAGAGDSSLILGAMTSTAQFCCSAAFQNNASFASGHSVTTDANCILLHGLNSALNVAATFVSFNSDGFTINVSTAHFTAPVIKWIAFGDGVDVSVGTFDLSSSTGAQAITGVGFEPKAMLFGWARPSTANGFAGGPFYLGLGVADAALGQCAAAATAMVQSGTGGRTDARRRFSSSACISGLHYLTSPQFEAALTSMDSDGFTLDVTTAGAVQIGYVAFGGSVEAIVGTDAQKAATGVESTSGLGFAPEFLLTLSGDLTAAGSEYDAQLVMGAAAGPSDQRTDAAWTEDATNPSSVGQIGKTGNILSFLDATRTVAAEAALASFDADGFTLDWTTADASPRLFGYLALAPATSAGETVVGAGGVSAVGAIGTVTATGGALVQPTGLSASGDIGTVTVGIVETVSATGVSASGSVGAATVTAGALVEPTGVSATGNIGNVTVAAGATVQPSGVSAQGRVGSVTTAYDMAVSVSGLAADGRVGTVTISGVGDATANATGVQAVGNIGTVTVAADHVLSVSGVQAEGRTGTVTATGGATVAVSGVSADGQVGSVTVLAGEVVSVSGVSAAGTVGTPTVTTGALAALAGVQAVGRIGNVGVLFDAAVLVTGLSAAGSVGTVVVQTGVAIARGPITPAIARGPITPAIARGPITPAIPRA